MKKFAIVLVALALSGCFKNEYSNIKFPEIPEELSDCKFFDIANKDGYRLQVVRCPNSTTTTTYTSGKSQQSVTVIDGVEYVKKEPEHLKP